MDAGGNRPRLSPRYRRMFIKWAVILAVAGIWLGYRAWSRATPAALPLPATTDPLKLRLDTATLHTESQVEATLVPPLGWERLDDGNGEIQLRVRGTVRNTGAVEQAVGVLLALAAHDGTVLAMARLTTPATAAGGTSPFEIAPLRLDPRVVPNIARWQVLLRPPREG